MNRSGAQEWKSLVAAVRGNDVGVAADILAAEPALASRGRLIVDAARFGGPQLVELLLGAGADPNARYRGYRPLHALIQERPHEGSTAVSEDRLRCLTLLLEGGADPSQMAAYPPAPALCVAAFSGRVVFVDALLDAGVTVDGFAEAALGRSEAVAARLKEDPGFATRRDRGVMTALQCTGASRMGHDEKGRRELYQTARCLLEAGAEVQAQTKAWSHQVDAACLAASSHQLEVFELLLSRGADANSALSAALWNATEEYAALALKHGARLDEARSQGKPLLNDMIRWGQHKQVEWLLARGADCNLGDERGWTAVHQAASRGNSRLLSAVLEAGGDPTLRNSRGRTPLDLARQAGRSVSVELLTDL